MTTSQDISCITILDVPISELDMDRAIDRLKALAAYDGSAYVTVNNVHSIIEFRDNDRFRRAVLGADLTLPDGRPLVWFSRLAGSKKLQQVRGPSLFRKMCTSPEYSQLKHFFYGSTDEVLSALKNNLRTANPGISIAGSYSPPFRDLTEKEDAAVVKMIDDSKADIVWVGLGLPRQEYWMADHVRLLNSAVLIGVGAAFDFVAETKPEAPAFLQKAGLEWLFRLLSEPGRLWRRYLSTNMRFLALSAAYFAVKQQR